MLNNCWLWAHVEYRRMVRKWRADGRQQDRVPIMYARPSRLAPDCINHWLVAYFDTYQDTMYGIRSFKPDDLAPLRWWQAWRVIVFTGRVWRGDHP